jgi:membrane dipeptidase
MKDAIAASRAPVIFSHSDVAALNAHPRSVPDDVLKLLPENGGVIMITFVPPFLSAEVWAWARERSAEEARLKSLYSYSKAKLDDGLKTWDQAHPRPEAQISTVADHIEHAVKIAGHDHVGIGGDLDGIPYPVAGLGGVDAYPRLFAELIRRGWSDRDLAKLAGGNILRVMRRAEAVASSMKDEAPSMATLEPAKSE